MKTILSLLLSLLSLSALADGITIRSLGGHGTNTLFYDTLGALSVDVTGRKVYDAGGVQKSLDWDARVAYDTVNIPSVLWSARQLNDASGAASINWDARTFSGTAWRFLSITNHSDVSAGAFASGNIWGFDGLTAKWTNGPPTVAITLTNAVGASFDGAGAAVAVGSKAYASVDRAGTIYQWEIIANGASPTCTIDVWKIAAGTAIPTIANTIMGTKPALSSGNVLRSSTTTGWTTLAMAKGDILIFNVDACTVATQLQFKLVYR